ncbi:SDR family oxidoreductase [Amycolatopsis rifamycinica]|uniref:SDR family oxidoreductase n=1 Tax=Amycolatopsis rifamycinica TaxID=287986 RepID=UPI000A8B9237|nr:NAD(P)H-binding protein [Amycolatopsis rifamycinica]
MFLVTGATGNVGDEVVSALAAAGAPVRALVRRPDAALPAGAEAAVGDLDSPAGLTDALKGVEGVFLLSGYEDMPGMLARAAEAGVRRIVLLSGGSAALADLDNAVSRYMTLSERAVRESGLDWTFLRPRAFSSNALRWLPQLRAGDTVRVRFPDVAAACVDPADIAAVAVAALAAGRAGRRAGFRAGPGPAVRGAVERRDAGGARGRHAGRVRRRGLGRSDGVPDRGRPGGRRGPSPSGPRPTRTPSADRVGGRRPPAGHRAHVDRIERRGFRG